MVWFLRRWKIRKKRVLRRSKKHFLIAFLQNVRRSFKISSTSRFRSLCLFIVCRNSSGAGAYCKKRDRRAGHSSDHGLEHRKEEGLMPGTPLGTPLESSKPDTFRDTGGHRHMFTFVLGWTMTKQSCTGQGEWKGIGDLLTNTWQLWMDMLELQWISHWQTSHEQCWVDLACLALAKMVASKIRSDELLGAWAAGRSSLHRYGCSSDHARLNPVSRRTNGDLLWLIESYCKSYWHL